MVSWVGTSLLLYNLIDAARGVGWGARGVGWGARGILPSGMRGRFPLKKLEPALALPLCIVRPLPTQGPPKPETPFVRPQVTETPEAPS